MTGPFAPSGLPPALGATVALLARARSGDTFARETLFGRFLPIVRRWARYRLPQSARGLADTDDLVQVTLMRALNRLEHFEHRREGAFLAYLRTILLNVVREEIRRARPDRHRLPFEGVAGAVASPARSELEQLIGREILERYERGLEALDETQREAVLLRLEFGYSHAEIAEALGKPSADAARMTVARALAALGEHLDGDPA
jgi:RNA polymerase sigma-70 factor (ECF subfamily)